MCTKHMDIPYTLSDEIVPPTRPYTAYPQTSFKEFLELIQKYNSDPSVWNYTIHNGVICRNPTSLDQIDYVCLCVARELLLKYKLKDVRAELTYNVSNVPFIAVYWTAEEAKDNSFDGDHPVVALNMYFMRYMPLQAMHDTILHEIAHAIVKDQAHTEDWRAVAVALGSSGRLESGSIDPQYIAENRYDSAIVFRCPRGCFECYNKAVDETTHIQNILDDCDKTSGELLDVRCEKHHLPIFLFPPRGTTIREYMDILMLNHLELFLLFNS
jgi:hypothetical protein